MICNLVAWTGELVFPLAATLSRPPANNLQPKVHAMLSAELIALEDRYGAHNYAPLDVVIERAAGALGVRHRKAGAIWIFWRPTPQ